ncbi:MAG: hypothetical protein HOQ32_08945 [Lysobacter sp.]|nr:hypothetical protein [Lysobacter sp.]
MSKWWSLALLSLQAFGAQAAQTAPAAAPAPTTVTILGVDHAAQLVSERDQPALLTAFLERVAPDAICIERAPEAYARGDYYEFTYEVQDVVVPYARREGIELCPIDWEPSVEDQRLGFGMSLDVPPELRLLKGFPSFLTFGADTLQRDLFRADDPANVAKVTQWAATPAKRGKDDLARRMYLYRTYLQARRILAAARAHPGGTIAVVVGEFHKHDIEAILKDEPGLRLTQPSSYGRPDAKQVAAHDRPEYRVAIASFNLLGQQSATGAVDYAFVGRTLEKLEAAGATPQTRLFRVRLELLQGKITRETAIARYRAIAAEAGDARFGWNGVKDAARVDSYFDAFGNLDVRRRALLEAARETWAAGDSAGAQALFEACAEGLNARQRNQLRGYWERDVAVKPAAEKAPGN